VAPLTVLTGVNATGKSFFNKTFYSILKTINKNVLHDSITENIKLLSFFLEMFEKELTRKGKKDKKQTDIFKKILKNITEQLVIIESVNIWLYMKKIAELSTKYLADISIFENYLKGLKKLQKFKSVKKTTEYILIELKILKEELTDTTGQYSSILGKKLHQELQENFQISDISELITPSNNNCEIISDDIKFNISTKENIAFTIGHKFIDEVFDFSRVVFFESPSYWRVMHVLNSAKKQNIKMI